MCWEVVLRTVRQKPVLFLPDTHRHTRTHARTHARTRTHTHTCPMWLAGLCYGLQSQSSSRLDRSSTCVPFRLKKYRHISHAKYQLHLPVSLLVRVVLSTRDSLFGCLWWCRRHSSHHFDTESVNSSLPSSSRRNESRERCSTASTLGLCK